MYSDLGCLGLFRVTLKHKSQAPAAFGFVLPQAAAGDGILRCPQLASEKLLGGPSLKATHNQPPFVCFVYFASRFSETCSIGVFRPTFN